MDTTFALIPIYVTDLTCSVWVRVYFSSPREAQGLSEGSVFVNGCVYACFKGITAWYTD